MSSYYNRYWQKKIKSKSQGEPPTWTRKNFEFHFDFLKPFLGANILDVGSGDGSFDHLLRQKKPGLKITSLEYSSIAINKGKKLYPKNTFIKGSSNRLPFLKDSFDTVFLIEVVEHLIDTDQTIREIHRVLKPGGHLLVTTTDFNLLKKVLISIFVWDKYFYPNNPHIRFFTHTTLKNVCHQQHLKLIKYQWNGDYFRLMPKGQMAIFKNDKT